jgi:6-phosphogluconolactonase
VSADLLVADIETLGSVLARDFELRAASAIAARGRFTVALPGGSVASQFFPHLAAISLDWSKIELFWVDERAVPPSDPESNYGLARSLWLGPARVPDAQIHRMPADARDLTRAASAYADELRRVAGDPPQLDVALIGVGPDGHVASIFPFAPGAANDRAIVVAVENAPKPPARRLTLSMDLLAGADRVVVAATGESKARVIRDALEDMHSVLPVAMLLQRARRASAAWVLLDPLAAALLSAT